MSERDALIAEARKSSEQMARELANFQEMASYIKPGPGDVPRFRGSTFAARRYH